MYFYIHLNNFFSWVELFSNRCGVMNNRRRIFYTYRIKIHILVLKNSQRYQCNINCKLYELYTLLYYTFYYERDACALLKYNKYCITL